MVYFQALLSVAIREKLRPLQTRQVRLAKSIFMYDQIHTHARMNSYDILTRQKLSYI